MRKIALATTTSAVVLSGLLVMPSAAQAGGHGETQTRQSNSAQTGWDEGLADEMWLHVSGYLFPQDLAALRETNHHLRAIAEDRQLWEQHKASLPLRALQTLRALSADMQTLVDKELDARITTVAGTGTGGYSGDNALAAAAQLAYPQGTARDAAGNVYVTDGGLLDSGNHRVRRIDAATGAITTVAGTGTRGSSGDNGLAIHAQLDSPKGLAMDTNGKLYIVDCHRVRMLDTATGVITTVAGTGELGSAGDGSPAVAAQVGSPEGVALDRQGNLYISQREQRRVRRVDAVTGIITTVAGNGSWGSAGDGGPAIAAEFASPEGLVVDNAGNLYISDSGNNRVRRVDATGMIATVVGTGERGSAGDGGSATAAQLAHPSGLALDTAGNLYIADNGNHRIRMVDSKGKINRVMGTGIPGRSEDAAATAAVKLRHPTGIMLDSAGYLYIADTDNHALRRIRTTH